MNRHIVVGALLLLGAAGCWQYRAGYCDQSHQQCAAGFTCDVNTHHCVPPDTLGTGGTGGAGGAMDAGRDVGMDLGPPPCDVDAHRCPPDKPFCDPDGICKSCDMTAQSCSALDATKPVCRPGGDAGVAASCVECLTMTDCHGTKPVCSVANTCVACTADTDCATVDPGVCMDDGHCATSADVVIVDETSGCADAGTTGSYCDLATAAAILEPKRNILVIRGPTNDRLTLQTMNVAPVVIGQPNRSGDPGSIPANASTAVTVLSDMVVIRDLTVNLGASSTSRGIAVSGSGTSAKLLRVTASLGKGLGIAIDSSASVFMDRSYVQTNSVGGILVNGATAVIQNTVITDNGGYGVQFSDAGVGTKFWFNTVIDSVAAVCSLGSTIVLQDSILVGSTPNCPSPVDCVTTMPTFDPNRPYHLVGPQVCPGSPDVSPADDIDGDPRGTKADCGADQYVAPH